MALTNNGTKVSLSGRDLPSGYTRAAITEFADYEQKYTDLELTINKSDVEAAAAGDALDDIIDDATVGIDKQVEDIITADFDVTNTVTAWIDFKNITSNQSTGEAAFYTNATPAYTVTVDVYVKTA
jgi:hypothetical protein